MLGLAQEYNWYLLHWYKACMTRREVWKLEVEWHKDSRARCVKVGLRIELEGLTYSLTWSPKNEWCKVYVMHDANVAIGGIKGRGVVGRSYQNETSTWCEPNSKQGTWRFFHFLSYKCVAWPYILNTLKLLYANMVEWLEVTLNVRLVVQRCGRWFDSCL